MSVGELQLAGRLAGVKENGDDKSVTVQAIVRRLAEVVGSDPNDPAGVERACLRKVAHDLGRDTALAGGTEVPEAEILEPLLVQVARQTLPIWRVSAAVLTLQGPLMRTEVTKVFEQVFLRVYPSDSSLQMLREVVGGLPPTAPMPSGLEVAGRVKTDATLLTSHPAWVEPTLVLILVLACADGKFNKEEERYFHAVADRIGVPLNAAQKLRDEVTAAFWSRRARLAPVHTEDPVEVRRNTLRAASATLETRGVLTLLAAVVCEEAVQAVHGGDKLHKDSWSKRLLGGLLGRGGQQDDILGLVMLTHICRPPS